MRRNDRRELDRYSGLTVEQYLDRVNNYGYISSREVYDIVEYLEMCCGIKTSDSMVFETKEVIDEYVDRLIRGAPYSHHRQCTEIVYCGHQEKPPVQTERANI